MKHKKSAPLSALVALLLVALLAVACENEVPEKPVPEPLPEPELIDPADYPAVRKSQVDPIHMWDAIHYGLFTDQKTSLKDPRVKDNPPEVSVDYTLFIPEAIETRHPLVIVVVPSGVKAEEFAAGPTGSDWIRAAEAGPHKFAVAFVEATDGGDWNLTEKAEGRDEGLALYAAFKEINSTSLDEKPWKAFYSLDKNRVSLVGYGTGAGAALIAAAEFPAAWANVTLVDLPEFDKAQIEADLDELALPYANAGNSNGMGSFLNKQVPLPIFLIDRDGDRKADEAVKSIHEATEEFVTPLDKTDEPDLRTVEFLDDMYAKDLYDTYLSRNGRYLGYDGGTIRGNFEIDDPGFTLREDSFTYGDGQLKSNRFLTYVPSNLDKEKPVSLVLALHGSSAALTDLISECRLNVLAEKENFIVCYCQAPVESGKLTPDWDATTQSAQLQHNIDWCLERYPFIDKSRVYAMGHSNGAMTLASNIIPVAPDMFAAYSLNGGYNSVPKGTPVSTVPVPVVGFMAQHDFFSSKGVPGLSDAAFPFPGMPKYGEVLKNYVAFSGFEPASDQEAVKSNPVGFAEGKYDMYDYVFEGAPLERFVGVGSSPHTFMAEEAMIAWDWMKHWTRDSEGHSLHDGKIVAPAAPEPPAGE